MKTQLKIIHPGEQLALGFTDPQGIDGGMIVRHAEEIRTLVETHQAKTLTLDFSNVPAISSSSFTILFSIFRHGVPVYLYQPRPAVQDVLRVTRLEEVFQETDVLPE